MRIGVVIDRWDPGKGGAERALDDLVRAAITAKHDVTVYAMSAADGAPGQLHRVTVPPSPRGLRDAAFAKRAVAAARRDGCDVVLGVRHVTGVDVYWPHGGVHAETLAAVERSKGRVGGAVSRALHGISPKQRALLALERRFFGDPRGARIWCVSELVRREIVTRWPECAPLVEVHANGVDTDTFNPRLRDGHRELMRRELNVANDVPLLLFLGGSWRLKGWPVLLAALSSIAGEKWICVAAGAKHEAAARAVARAGLSKRVRVLPQTGARSLYAAADLFVQPTWRDPCSLATLEALACGIPVVTTDANGAADAFADLPAAGDVVPSGDAAALTRAITRRLTVLRIPSADARRAAERRAKSAWIDGLLRSLGRAATCR
jgi:UDP-glucose:(heptosyl)LPS alpha-1,3-glucosyltransferase